MLATGGIGRAYKITSNSWEYTGDGHVARVSTPARNCMDMEFIQFHPTGMVWPPSVHGHSGHRRRARRRRRACATRKASASCSTTSRRTTKRRPRHDPEEGWRYTQGDKNARRPPELLTRDHVARCIKREVKAGAAARTAACSSTSPGSRRRFPNARGAHQEEAARACITSSCSWPTSTSPRSRWKSARRRITSWAASAWTATRR